VTYAFLVIEQAEPGTGDRSDVLTRAAFDGRRPTALRMPGPTLAPGAAGCRYWSCARAAAELRMLRPGPRPGIPGRVHLHVRVHLVPRLRGERPTQGLSELRRRTRPAPHP